MLKELNCTAKLRFSQNFSKSADNYIVFQVDDQILNELAKKGYVDIKG
jgi:hypothetical protein